MQKLVLILLVIPLAGLSCAQKTAPPPFPTTTIIQGEVEEKEPPGDTWRSLSKGKKTVLTDGIILGINNVVKENMVFLPESGSTKRNDELAEKLEKLLVLYIRQKFARKPTEDEVRLLLTYEKELRNKKLIEFGVFDVSVKEIIAGVDRLYEEPKNRNIAIVDAMYLVRKKSQGAPTEDMERLVNYLRGGKKDRALLNVKDERGKTRRIIHFP